MRVHICAVGRLRAGPERELLDDYLTRFDRTGRALGIGPVSLHEVDDRKGGGMTAEAALLDRAIPDGSVIVALDERGFVVTGGTDAHHPFETSLPGIFAVGDIRAGSVKRVASSVGEGSVVMSAVWEHLNG